MLRKSSNCFKIRLSRIILTGVIAFLSFTLAACSSSDNDDGAGTGGGSSTQADLLDGTYFMGIFADSSGTGDMWNQINDTEFDGQGSYDNIIEYDSDGDSGTGSGNYTVDSDGEIAFTTDADIAGLSSSDGTFFSIIDTNPAEILLGAGVQASSGMTAADLTGNYVAGQVRYDVGGINTARFQFTFDGAGAVSGTIEADSDAGAGTALTGTYTVSDDGGLDLTITGLTKDFEGQISSDGELMVIMDTDNDGEVLMMVGIKETTGADESLLSGNYQLNQFGGDNTDNWTTRIEATADGSGQIAAQILADSGGDLTAPPPFAYTVSADGALAITGTNDVGIVSADGSIFIIMDAVGADDEVTFTIGIKKS